MIDLLNAEKEATNWENGPCGSRDKTVQGSYEPCTAIIVRSSLLRPYYRVQHPAEEPHGQDPGLGGEDW